MNDLEILLSFFFSKLNCQLHPLQITKHGSFMKLMLILTYLQIETWLRVHRFICGLSILGLEQQKNNL